MAYGKWFDSTPLHYEKKTMKTKTKQTRSAIEGG